MHTGIIPVNRESCFRFFVLFPKRLTKETTDMQLNIEKVKKYYNKFGTELADMILLNLLWLVSSLPLVTIGASTTALLSVNFSKLKMQEGELIRSYFTAFKKNFRQATGIFLFLVFLVLDGWILYRYLFAGSQVLRMVLTACAVVLTAMSLYLFGLQAYFKNTVVQTFVNGLGLSFRHFGGTLKLAVLWAAILLFSRYVFPPFLLAGVGLGANISCRILHGIFEKYTTDPQCVI